MASSAPLAHQQQGSHRSYSAVTLSESISELTERLLEQGVIYEHEPDAECSSNYLANANLANSNSNIGAKCGGGAAKKSVSIATAPCYRMEVTDSGYYSSGPLPNGFPVPPPGAGTMEPADVKMRPKKKKSWAGMGTREADKERDVDEKTQAAARKSWHRRLSFGSFGGGASGTSPQKNGFDAAQMSASTGPLDDRRMVRTFYGGGKLVWSMQKTDRTGVNF